MTSNIWHQFSWYRGDAISSNMGDDIDIFYCNGTKHIAFKINRSIIGEKYLDYNEDYSFLKGGYGIYFLYGIENTSRGKVMNVYVGKAEARANPHGMDRLVEHVQNDEKARLGYHNKWNKALYITIKEDTSKNRPDFTPGVIKALERVFIAMFQGLAATTNEDKKSEVKIICHNSKIGEQSNEPFDNYKTHIHAIIALLCHAGIRIIPEICEKQFMQEYQAEGTRELSNEISRTRLEYEAKIAELKEYVDNQKKKEAEKLSEENLNIKNSIVSNFTDTILKYNDTSEVIINGRVYTASELNTLSKSSTVLTGYNIAYQMCGLIPEEVLKDSSTKYLLMYSKDGVFGKALMDRILDSCGEVSNQLKMSTLRSLVGDRLYIIFPSAECSNLTMKNLLNYYCELMAKLDNMWGFDYRNCVLPHVIIIRNMETNVKTLDGKKFIKDRIEEEFETVKFDVVIGNPPYNNDIYLDFVTLGDQLADKATVMITPAKWQAKGGGKNEEFRKNIVPRMSDIVYYPVATDLFDIKEWDGISYYLIDKQNKHDVKHIKNLCVWQRLFNNETNRVIGSHLNNILVGILDKITLSSNFKQLHVDFDSSYYLTADQCKGLSQLDSDYHNIAVLGGDSQGNLREVGYANKSELSKHLSSIDHYKIIMHCMPGRNGTLVSDGTTYGNSDVKVINPGYICKNAYLVLYTTNNKDEAYSFLSYMKTRLIRLTTYCGCVGSQAGCNEFWRFVPAPDAFDHIFTDKELYDKYNLTPEEIAIIESVIKERK